MALRSLYQPFLLAGVLACSALSPTLQAEPIPVLHLEGTLHGYLVVRTPEGKLLASGDLIQTVKGNRVTGELIFHFKDGSLDDENFVYEQRQAFSLITDRRVQ